MAEVVEMLALSPTMDEGTLAEWTKQKGDPVKEGDILAEIETDKAVMEMEAFHEGTLLEILADAGDTVEVGAPIAIVGREDEDISDLLETLQSTDEPDEEQSDSEDADQAEPTQSAQAPESERQTEEPLPEPSEQKAVTAEPSGRTDGRIKASPLAKRIAKEAGIDLGSIAGSGPSGRIIKKDIEEAKKRRPSPADGEPQQTEPEKIELSQMRKTIASRLQEAWRTTPHFTLSRDVDMAKAMQFRADANEQLEATGNEAKISVNDMIVRASALALKAEPSVNVSFEGDHLLQHKQVHVGFAVAVEEGLITPTIENADDKSLQQIGQQSRDLASRARERKLTPDEYSGATFTVSNLGMYDIDNFMAVINPPQAAILACGAVRQKPVVEDGQLDVGTRMSVTLSCDHRAIDGATGAEFLDVLVKHLENPLLLTL